jgi:hypothetical protein
MQPPTPADTYISEAAAGRAARRMGHAFEARARCDQAQRGHVPVTQDRQVESWLPRCSGARTLGSLADPLSRDALGR